MSLVGFADLYTAGPYRTRRDAQLSIGTMCLTRDAAIEHIEIRDVNAPAPGAQAELVARVNAECIAALGAQVADLIPWARDSVRDYPSAAARDLKLRIDGGEFGPTPASIASLTTSADLDEYLGFA